MTNLLDYMTPASDYNINTEVRDYAIGLINKGTPLSTVWMRITQKFSGWDIGNNEAHNIREEIDRYYWA